MIAIGRDVTNPDMPILLMAAAFEATPDGGTSVRMPDGYNGLTPCYAYQEAGPGQNGVFKFTSDPMGAYQRCRVQGQLVAWWTRPQDPVHVYTWAELPN